LVRLSVCFCCYFFFSSRRRHTRSKRDWSSDVCSSDLTGGEALGVDVGELLELERSLHRHRIADVAAEEQHRTDVLVAVGQGQHLRLRLIEDVLDLDRKSVV